MNNTYPWEDGTQECCGPVEKELQVTGELRRLDKQTEELYMSLSDLRSRLQAVLVDEPKPGATTKENEDSIVSLAQDIKANRERVAHSQQIVNELIRCLQI